MPTSSRTRNPAARPLAGNKKSKRVRGDRRPGRDPASDAEARLRVTRGVLAIGLIAGMLWSLPLWLSDRPFPLFPRFEFVPSLLPPFDRIAVALILALAVAVVVRSRPHREIFALCFGLLALIAVDHTRCQPWVYQYAVMLLVAAPGPGAPSRVAALQLMFAAIYFWSGLQKVNPVFVAESFPALIQPLAGYLPQSLASWIGGAGYAAAAAEALIAPALLAPRTRRLGVIAVAALHVMILLSIGPLGAARNRAVWPWNAAMILLAVTLFVGARDRIAARAAWFDAPGVWLRRAALVAFLVLPVLSFFRLWPGHLSWNLYSGIVLQGRMTVANAAVPCLPEDLRQGLRPLGPDTQAASILDWGMFAFDATPYSEWWVYRRVRDRACVCDPEGKWITFTLLDPARWSPSEVQRYRCGQPW